MTDQNEGKYSGNTYVFDDPGNNTYRRTNWSRADDYLEGFERRYYTSQWSGYNQVYFDPTIAYDPWPRWNTLSDTDGSGGSLNFNADPDSPRAHPVDSGHTLNLDSVYLRVAQSPVAMSTVQRVVLERTGSGNGATYASTVFLEGPGGTYVFDNATDHFSLSGNWTKTSNNYDYGRTLWYSWSNGNTATWPLYGINAGTYTVYVSYTNGGDTNARYTTYHQSSNHVVVDSQRGAEYYRWYNGSRYYVVRLGQWSFDAESTPAMYEIHNSHYYTQYNGNTYLVDLNGSSASGSFVFYRFDDDGDGFIEDGELTLLNSGTDASEIAAIRPKNANGTNQSYADARQNFANWYSFYRKRHLTAKAAVGRVIEDISEAQIGYRTINHSSTRAVVEIDMADGTDNTDSLLNSMYSQVDADGGTPLRRGLEDVGQYYDQTDGNSGGISSTNPWATDGDGGSCQRGFAIAMTDGYYNGGNPSSIIGNADSDGNTEFDGGEYGRNSHYRTLADVAMYYYERDLDPGVMNFVLPHNQDIAPHQHMTTYGVAFGVNGTLDPASYPDCAPRCEAGELNCPPINCSDGSGDVIWPDPSSGYTERVDDLYHASVNGRGLFMSAGNPTALVNSLIDIMQDIQDMVGTGASVTINAQDLQSNTYLFQAFYNSGDWSGDLVAYPLNSSTGAIDTFINASGIEEKVLAWSAADQLDLLGWSNRKIITYNGTTGIPFTYGDLSSSLTSTEMSDFGATTSDQQNTISFLRGDDSLEGTTFRDRSSMIGDIVHSSPVHVEIDGLPYNDPMHSPGFVAVGANDGMVHFFKEDTGDEIFAYVPKLIHPTIANLADPLYLHHTYVDAEVYAETINSDDGSTANDIRLVVGGLGRGGKGYYCLNVTGAENLLFDAEFDAASIVKWEYPSINDPDLGYTYSDAYIVNSKDGWVVIFGNGYESDNGKAVLYVIKLDSDGAIDVVEKLDTGVGDPSVNCNGLSTPTLIDVDLDGLVDYGYAGDLLGNMWKFDFTGSTVGSWKVAYDDSSNVPQPLFTARNADGDIQSITSKPDVMRACGGRKGYLVVYGTGRYLGLEDLADVGTVQSIYGIWDWGDAWIAAGETPEDKYLGYFTSTRLPSNLVGNPNMEGADEWIYSIDLTSASTGDTVTIKGETFTFSVITDVPNAQFSGATGLVNCVNDTTDGVPGVRAEGSGRRSQFGIIRQMMQ